MHIPKQLEKSVFRLERKLPRTDDCRLRNFRLIISYDGTCFFGWQKTKTGPSIEEALEKAVSIILGTSVSLEAASRTDRGVHARGQVVHFLTDREIDCRRFKRSLNALLPPEISVLSIDPVDPSFHPTLDATGKEYHYWICNDPVQTPMNRLYSWHVPQKLDLPRMQAASRDFLGTHDFSALSNERTSDAVRTVSDIQFVSTETSRLCIEIHGDRFLYKMVRNIVGTLVQIGLEKLPLDCIPSILGSKKRENAGMTAPAHGLFLMRVFYPPFQLK